MRNRSTIEFLGLWEQLNNPDFKGVEFDSFKNQAGDNAFTMSPQKWITNTNAIGIRSVSGRYGELLPTKILHLSLLLGFPQNSSFMLLKTISDSKKMRTADYHLIGIYAEPYRKQIIKYILMQ